MTQSGTGPAPTPAQAGKISFLTTDLFATLVVASIWFAFFTVTALAAFL